MAIIFSGAQLFDAFSAFNDWLGSEVVIVQSTLPEMGDKATELRNVYT